jgi:hypothetical protein
MSARIQHTNRELNDALSMNYKCAIPKYNVNNTTFSEVAVCATRQYRL